MSTNAYQRLFGIIVSFDTDFHSKDLFPPISTSNTPEEKPIAIDVQFMRYSFETHRLNKLIWISGRANLADPLTKKDNPIADLLQLTIFKDVLTLDLYAVESRESNVSLGEENIFCKDMGMYKF